MSDMPIEFRRGYGLAFGIRFQTSVDLTTATIDWVLADGSFRGARVWLAKATGNGIGISRDDATNPPTWTITVEVGDTDTVGIPCGTYYHECKVSPPDIDSHCPASGRATVVDSPIAPL